MRGKIEFENVHLTYTGTETVLPDFSLTIQPGESVALVGHTGAGKSSIARLITRFCEFQDGRILLDSQDIRTLDLNPYRRHLGIVPQDPFLFSATVRKNIRYSRSEATDQEIEAIAQQISDGDWLEALPDGRRHKFRRGWRR